MEKDVRMIRKNRVSLYLVAVILGAFVFAPLASAADVYEIDLAHSTIGFSVKHLSVAKVSGSFRDYSSMLEYDPSDLNTFKAEATINVSSISTNNDARDNHLRSADFFDAEKFPTITFQSKKLEQNGEGYTLVGDLTIKGVTKEVSVPVSIAGPVDGPSGAVIGLAGSVVINRQDFGVSWNKTLDSGGLVVSDDVTISLEIEANKK